MDLFCFLAFSWASFGPGHDDGDDGDDDGDDDFAVVVWSCCSVLMM